MTRSLSERYSALEELGSGAFSTVFRGRDEVFGREVALKVMHPALLSDPTFVERFSQEAQVVANLRHPNIVTVYDYGEYDDRLCLVMDFLPGGSLADLLDAGRLPWERALAITQQVAGALDYAHERDLVHRDVKPPNVLLDEEGRAVLADFGVVRALESGTVASTLSGGVVGTAAYIPVEIWDGKEPSPGTDVYALACVVYEMVTGERLYEGSSLSNTIARHMRPPAFPEAWPEEVPAGIEQTLAKALARDPAERYARAGAFVEALSDLESDPLAERYAALEAAVAAGKWDDALRLGRSILEHDADYRRAQALHEEATAGKAAAERRAEVARWREATTAALDADEWEKALSAARQWREVAPEDEAAAAALARAEEALAPQDEAEEAVEEDGPRETPDESAEGAGAGAATRADRRRVDRRRVQGRLNRDVAQRLQQPAERPDSWVRRGIVRLASVLGRVLVVALFLNFSLLYLIGLAPASILLVGAIIATVVFTVWGGADPPWLLRLARLLGIALVLEAGLLLAGFNVGWIFPVALVAAGAVALDAFVAGFMAG